MYCVGNGPYNDLIMSSEESYRVLIYVCVCVIVCVIVVIYDLNNEAAWARVKLFHHREKNTAFPVPQGTTHDKTQSVISKVF